MHRGEYMFRKKLKKADGAKFDTSLLLDNSPQVSDDYSDEAEILHYKIKTEGVKNIAVVASFGAGKSSAIETYLSMRRKGEEEKNTYTKISLASFNDTEYKESDVERSILQQLLYSQPKRKLPNSRVERTTATSKKWSVFLALVILVFIVSSVLFGLQMSKLFLHRIKWLNWIFLICSSISFFILTCIVLHFRKLRSIKYKDFEIEMRKDGEDQVQSGQSLINKFVDEVLYFFESTEINLVIFEDLDRLADEKSSAIFVKLRELNTIINNSHQRKGKVTFLYAVKDDMIKKQEERAKFFEFILPIVPILNPVTKALKMHEEHDRLVKKELGIALDSKIDDEKLKESKLKLDSEFINAVSIYVPNMRTLKNGFNDYIITRDRIFKDSAEGRLQNENLFALCLYKNLYPDDYARLEQDKGLIPIVMDKSHLISDEVKVSQELILKLQEFLKKVDAEHLKNFEELKSILWGQICEKGNAHSSKPLVAFGTIKTFQGFDFSTIKHQSSGYYNNYAINLPENFAMPNGDSYVEREQIILAKTKESKERIAAQIEKEQQNIVKYETMSLNELIKKRGIDFHFRIAGDKETTKAYLAELKNISVDRQEENNLQLFNKNSKQLGYLKFLIQNGYIDENYMEYTSSYKSTLISATDESFIRKVQQGEQVFTHKIDNPGSVFNQLRVKSFADSAILNNTVLANLKLLKEQSKKNEKYQTIRTLLNQEQADEAISTFIQTNNDNKVLEFLEEIIDGKTKICGRLLASELVKAKKDLVVIALIEGVKDYKAHNIENKITGYINEAENYEEIFNRVNINKTKKFLMQIQPRIGALNNTRSEITSYIIENSFYAINVANLKIVCGVDGAGGDFFEANYAFVSVNSKLKEHVDANANEYVKSVLASEEIPNGREDCAVAVDFLNRAGVTLPQKIQIIQKYGFIVDSIDGYNTELHSFLLQHDRVKPTWKNVIFARMKSSGLNDVLKSFIVRNAGKIEDAFEFSSDSDGNGTDGSVAQDICRTLFVELANAEYTSEERPGLVIVAEKIDFAFELTNEYGRDDNLAVFIDAGNISYNNGDLSQLLTKPKSLCKYVKKYNAEINEEFEDFFEEIDAQGLKALMLDDQIPVGTKQMLITEYSSKMTAVSGFEKQYYNVIQQNNLSIPIVLLMRFKSSALTKDEKQNLAVLTNDREEAMELFREYMECIMPQLQPENKEVKIYTQNIQERELLELYSQASGRRLGRGRDGTTIAVKKLGK